MFCPNCGKETDANGKVCVHCGQPTGGGGKSFMDTVKQTVAKLGKKQKIGIIAGLVAVIALIVFLAVFNGAEAKMNRAISKGNISEAIQIYAEDLNGDRLSQKSLDGLKKAADSAASSYESGSYTYDRVDAIMDGIEELILRSYGAYSGSSSSSSLSDLFNGMSSSLTNYAEARQTVNEVTGEALEKINVIHSCNEYIEKAEKYMQNNEYSEAIDMYNRAIEVYEGSEKAAEGLAAATEAYRSGKIEEANKLAAEGNWDDAISLLEEALEEFESDETLKAAYDNLVNTRPVSLLNIVMVSSDNVRTDGREVKDRYGATYDGAAIYGSNSFALYNLDGKYKTFKATAFVSTDSDRDLDITVTIYKDKEAGYAFKKNHISEETKPFEISVDVTDVSTLRIVVEKMSGGWGDLCFGASSFERADVAPGSAEAAE